MTAQLYGHPFSSYTWKALIPLWEKNAAFEFREVGPDFSENSEELARRSASGKFPLLVDNGRNIWEATAIIEYLDVIEPQPRLIPDGIAGVEVRMLDRFFDNYVMGAMQLIVNQRIGIASDDEAERGRTQLGKSYAWLDENLPPDAWANGDSFSLADCAAAPSLFYADWVHPIPEALAVLKSYRARLLAHPTVARAVDGARPYRHLFPGGAPDRD